MITNEQKLKFQIMNQEKLNNELIDACALGKIEVVRYLLTSTELKEHADISHNNDHALMRACIYGHLDIVQYLLTSTELTKHADIHSNNENALVNACFHGYLEIVQYLLSSPYLKEHANIHADNDDPIIQACMNRQIFVIQYLIFDYHIEKTEQIEQYLIENNRVHILNLFDKRQLKEELEKTLKNENLTNKNLKL